MLKRISQFWISILLIIALTLLGGLIPLSSMAESDDGNLLRNGDFSLLDEDGLPVDWDVDAYVLEPGYTVFSVTDTDPTFPHAAAIHNIALNDARFAQTVQVEPETLYCLSGYVKAEGATTGHGANLSIEGVYTFSEEWLDTDGEWEYIEWYGETGPDQQTVTVFARLGGYSGESRGKAWFADLRLEEAEEVPGDEIAARWFKTATASYSDDDEEDDEEDGEAAPAWPWMLGAGMLYCIAGIWLILRSHDGDALPEITETRKHTPLAIGAFALALILRIVLSGQIEGYLVDVNCFLSWGNTMSNWGPTQFYLKTNFCDYPPLYTYVLGMNAWIRTTMNLGTAGTRIVFRLIPCLCDVVACWMIYELVRKRLTGGRRWAEWVLIFTAFNPATILNSAAWGQMDSVLCLMILGTAILATEEEWCKALPLYVISALVKPQALMLGPLGLVYYGLSWKRHPENRKKMLLALGMSLGLMVILVIPFSVNQEPDWLIKQYAETLASYPYATVNTANFYYLLGGNWSSITNPAPWAAPILLCVGTIAYGLWRIRRGIQHSEKGLKIEGGLIAAFAAFFAICAIAGWGWNLVGIGAMAMSFVIVIGMTIRSGKPALMSYLGGLLFILLYVFGIKMHERYLFPALTLMTLAWVILRDRRILYVIGLFTFTLFLNEGIVLDNSIRLGSSYGHLNADTVVLADALSVINCCAALYAVWLEGQILDEKRPKMMPVAIGTDMILEHRKTRLLAETPDKRLHWKRLDTILLAGITAVYAAINLTTLGSGKAPQTSWTSTDYEETIVFDLGDDHPNASMLYFGQVSRYDFGLAQSRDGKNWSEEVYAQMDQGQCWRWKYVTENIELDSGSRTYFNGSWNNVIRFTCRYVKLTAHQVGLTLNEVIFRDAENRIIPVVITDRYGYEEESELYSDAGNLIDEQDTMEGLPTWFGTDTEGMDAEPEPCWWNSMYFDEIYHARTAYEFNRGTVPYETTHPPLGKVLMSWCISLFGMTPFGWRLAGAIAGILMLPGIYLTAKQLTKKTWIAASACLLLALDCQHLTQTQIATIDSFPVLFILFSFWFMLRFLQTDLVRMEMKKIIPDLAGSGICIGLAIASKWIGLYAAVGLGVLFFWHCGRTIWIRREAERLIREGGLSAEETERLSPYLKQEGQKLKPDLRRILALIGWCVIFFGIVPLGIYLASYVPYFRYNGRIKGIRDYLTNVWNAQQSMLNYHSQEGLGSDHPFYSPWWEWPIMGKPMYYSSKQYLPTETDYYYSIFCFGNPVVWFGGLGALAIGLIRWMWEKWRAAVGTGESSGPARGAYVFLFVGILAQYLPWTLVPRGTYIYHYFATVPFLVIAMALCMDGWNGQARKIARIATMAVLAAALVFFILLFPYASGALAPTGWLDIGKSMLRIWY